MAVATGRDAIDATIGAVQGQFAGLTFALTGPVDAHHHQARFGAVPPLGNPQAVGTRFR